MQEAAFRRVCDAMGSHDLDALVSVYTEDVHFVDKTLRWDLHGRDELRDHFGLWFAATSRLGMSALDRVHAAGRAAFLWRTFGTVLSGQRFDVPGTSLFTFTAAGQISHETVQWNLADLPDQAARDMGLRPAAASELFVAPVANGRGTEAARLVERHRARRKGIPEHHQG
ncbi:nuclear transport factor 2 family protein [Streptomyces sp. ISL-22]|uniref:nuclear transport factor 2 family protein n=1 Tax=Streptomyces TaxID=1883 RepID=UPI001BE8179F|nr:MULTISPECIES: nuclear transport factor 2 family protein [Streptomyces]MBT2434514.1 nuclear transport factor 2 family protein [Streptomyces sp. ISL-22]